jgi:hypothetical protein
MNTITRRTALAAPVTLPLLPVSAFAAPADPAVEAYHAWRAAHDAFEGSLEYGDGTDTSPIVKAAHDDEWTALAKLCRTVPTTAAGLACQLSFTVEVLGEYVSGNLAGDLDGTLIRNMLAGAEGLANA